MPPFRVSPTGQREAFSNLKEGGFYREIIRTGTGTNEKRLTLAQLPPESLPDVSGMTFDNALSRKERITRFLQIVKNPYCFCIGGIGVQIEFSENGPSLQDTLTDYLIRQKSGL